MQTMKYLFYSSLFLVSLNVWASDQIDTAARLLSLDFAPFINTSKRDIVTYNYRKKDMLNLKDSKESLRSDSPEAIAYAKEWTHTIKKFTPQESGYLGWGFYTSNNPISSQDFAVDENSFALITQKFKKGAKFLDLRTLTQENSFPISKETMAYINKICYLPAMAPSGTHKEGPSGYYTFSKLFMSRDQKCNQIFIKALDNLKVDSILYSWKDEDFNFCDAEKTYAAFINVNGELSKNTVELVFDPTDKMKEEAKLINSGKMKPENFSLGKETFEAYQNYSTFINATSGNKTNYGKLLQDFEPTNQKQKDKIISKLKKEAFGCDKKYENEDKPFFDEKNALIETLNVEMKNLKSTIDINGVNGEQCK